MIGAIGGRLLGALRGSLDDIAKAVAPKVQSIQSALPSIGQKVQNVLKDNISLTSPTNIPLSVKVDKTAEAISAIQKVSPELKVLQQESFKKALEAKFSVDGGSYFIKSTSVPTYVGTPVEGLGGVLGGVAKTLPVGAGIQTGLILSDPAAREAYSSAIYSGLQRIESGDYVGAAEVLAPKAASFATLSAIWGGVTSLAVSNVIVPAVGSIGAGLAIRGKSVFNPLLSAAWLQDKFGYGLAKIGPGVATKNVKDIYSYIASPITSAGKAGGELLIGFGGFLRTQNRPVLSRAADIFEKTGVSVARASNVLKPFEVGGVSFAIGEYGVRSLVDPQNADTTLIGGVVKRAKESYSNLVLKDDLSGVQDYLLFTGLYGIGGKVLGTRFISRVGDVFAGLPVLSGDYGAALYARATERLVEEQQLGDRLIDVIRPATGFGSIFDRILPAAEIRGMGYSLLFDVKTNQLLVTKDPGKIDYVSLTRYRLGDQYLLADKNLPREMLPDLFNVPSSMFIEYRDVALSNQLMLGGREDLAFIQNLPPDDPYRQAVEGILRSPASLLPSKLRDFAKRYVKENDPDSLLNYMLMLEKKVFDQGIYSPPTFNPKVIEERMAQAKEKLAKLNLDKPGNNVVKALVATQLVFLLSTLQNLRSSGEFTQGLLNPAPIESAVKSRIRAQKIYRSRAVKELGLFSRKEADDELLVYATYKYLRDSLLKEKSALPSNIENVQPLDLSFNYLSFSEIKEKERAVLEKVTKKIESNLEKLNKKVNELAELLEKKRATRRNLEEELVKLTPFLIDLPDSTKTLENLKETLSNLKLQKSEKTKVKKLIKQLEEEIRYFEQKRSDIFSQIKELAKELNIATGDPKTIQEYQDELNAIKQKLDDAEQIFISNIEDELRKTLKEEQRPDSEISSTTRRSDTPSSDITRIVSDPSAIFLGAPPLLPPPLPPSDNSSGGSGPSSPKIGGFDAIRLI